LGQVVSQAELISRRGDWERAGRVVVCVSGVFDFLHPGHVRLLEHARSLGDVLIVAVQGDQAARQRFAADRSHNPSIVRPLTPACERVEVLRALAAVDFVTVFEQASPGELLSQLTPDIVVDAGQAEGRVGGAKPAKRTRYRVVHIPAEPGYSTTRLIERIAELPE
jgi:rfaE bifunctional protein nucleotidyltransferase chain/domain